MASGILGPETARKTVTVLFCDIAGWTATAERLDPEPLHRVLSRYQEVTTAVIARHGGTLEKFVGDAVMAVFGVPTLHEDDALRAVRTAAELGSAISALSDEVERDWGIRIEVKVAVNTGEVIAGEDSLGHPRLAGDALNVAARLEEEFARPGDVVLGHGTYRLVRQVVRAEPVPESRVSGREGPVRAWRLVAIEDLSPLEQPPASPFAGRRRELTQLQQALEYARAERICVICTVVGPPGIGKSRLAREFIDGTAGSVRVAGGRCLSYGEGVTYWPLREIVTELAGDHPRDWIRTRLSDDPSAAAVAERVSAAIGEGAGGAQPEETFWAFRKLFEAVAAERPLLLAVDDIHWAERTLIDLFDHVARLSVGAPILILCLTRPDLYEDHPDWAIPQPNRVVISLPPLSAAESSGLVEGLEGAHELAAQARARAVETAEGNPLFLEQLVAFGSEGGSADDLPPNIDALLAARIERLDEGERAALGHAAIEGRTFRRQALEALLPAAQRATLDARLLKLVRKDFIEPYSTASLAGDVFRFRHVLLRDAAYESMAKALRAELHERHSGWLEAFGGEDEIIGYHLEQAYRYDHEVSPAGQRRSDLALRAAERLGSAGHAALSRGDVVGAANLLSRATSLPPADAGVRLRLLPGLADALSSVGDLDRARAVLGEATQLAAAAGDVQMIWRTRLQASWLRLHSDPTADVAEIHLEASAAVAVFEEASDDSALAHAWHLIAWIETNNGRLSALANAVQRGIAHARAAGDAMTEEDLTVLTLLTGPTGPAPLAQVIATAEAELERAREAGSRRVEAASLIALAMCAAFRTEFERARGLVAEAKSIDDELGGARGSGFQYWPAGLVELLSGDAVQAERVLRDGYEVLRARGDNWFMCGVAAELADALWLLGRDDEALELTHISEKTTPEHDPIGEMMWRGARAKVLARRGQAEEAEMLAREALAIIEQTDYVLYHADALTDLAQVLRLLDRPEEAATVAEEACRLYEGKGNVAAAEAARALQGRPSLA